jgi:predicted HD phosphohydrolase
VAVADGNSLRVVLALRAHDLGHLFLHQFGEDAESDAH